MVKHVKERVEIICRLIDVHHKDGPVRANACPQGHDCGAHWSERILSLRCPVIGNYDRLIASVESDLLCRPLQEWQRQVATSCRNSGMPIVRTADFHVTFL